MICQIAQPTRPCIDCLVEALLEAEPESDEWRDALEQLIMAKDGPPLSWIRDLLDWQENVLAKRKGERERRQ